ncbi:MAG: hypothetical protein JOZ38_12055 [Candidatus Eremiobacteraeota bacterium]|nr:hypothetical protein [Candidatus Eremiobacteraeota bacterium]
MTSQALPHGRYSVEMTERLGSGLFAFSIAAMGVTSLVWMNAGVEFTKGSLVLPIMPYPPAGAVLAVLFGIVMIVCGAMMFRTSTARMGAIVFAAVYVFAALFFDLPRLIGHPGSIGLRTLFFQPLALAGLAWMLPAAQLPNDWRMHFARYSIAAALIVFGADHFATLGSIASIVPGWIPFHTFWAIFFGIAFIAAGLSFATNLLRGWAAAGLALMFAIFDATIHIPAALGSRDPDSWCSIFIVSALCGGFLALAEVRSRPAP